MPLRMLFTPTERERLGVIINNISIYATQIIMQSGADLTGRALANLAKAKLEDEALLKRLDQLAREQNDESALRLIEDLPKIPADMVQMLALVRRCLQASAFLGHCIAQPNHAEISAATVTRENRLH